MKVEKGEKKTTAKVSTGSEQEEQQFSYENQSEKKFSSSRDFNSFGDENIISKTMKICRRILLKTVIIIIIFFRLMKKLS